MSEPKKEAKIIIIEENIKVIENTIYDSTIKCQVGKIANDDVMVKNAEESLEKLLKMKDAYNKILRELKKP